MRAELLLVVLLLVSGCQNALITNLVAGKNVDNGQVVPGSCEDCEDDPYPGVFNTVTFETDSTVLSPAAQAILQKQATWIKRYPAHHILLEGYADERGTREYNLALGERRAQAVMNYLVALGIAPARLKEISYGKERSICLESSEVCWQKNRRVLSTVDD